MKYVHANNVPSSEGIPFSVLSLLPLAAGEGQDRSPLFFIRHQSLHHSPSSCHRFWIVMLVEAETHPHKVMLVVEQVSKHSRIGRRRFMRLNRRYFLIFEKLSIFIV